MSRKPVAERTLPPENGSGLSDVALRQRDRVIDAAIEIIATQGSHRLSRDKIAEAHSGWRQMLAGDYAESLARPPVPPAIAASIVMALIQGLSGQLAVDPGAFDRKQMLAAVTDLLAPLYRPTPPPHQGDR